MGKHQAERIKDLSRILNQNLMRTGLVAHTNIYTTPEKKQKTIHIEYTLNPKVSKKEFVKGYTELTSPLEMVLTTNYGGIVEIKCDKYDPNNPNETRRIHLKLETVLVLDQDVFECDLFSAINNEVENYLKRNHKQPAKRSKKKKKNKAQEE